MSLIRIEDAWKSFGDIAVLKGVSLTVKEGEIVAVLGRSGSGKSTLLRCINGLEKIDSGKIWVDETLVSAPDVDIRGLREKVGIVFQSYNLFPHLSVERNITLAPMVVKHIKREDAHEIALDVLRRVGLEVKIDAYPDQLSGGEQQRVAIARSLAMSPKVILFDEITSAIDPELTGEVLRTLEELAGQGWTMLLVTHEIGFARNIAHRAIFMHEGKVWEEGPPKQVLIEPETEQLRNFIKSVLV
jgi:polar amino acid transport system ATP-binding protein